MNNKPEFYYIVLKVTALRISWNRHAQCLSHLHFNATTGNSSCSVVPQEMKERKTNKEKPSSESPNRETIKQTETQVSSQVIHFSSFCLVWPECLVIFTATVVCVWMMVCLIVSHFALKFHTKDPNMTICCYETPRRRHQLGNNMVGLLLQKTLDATTFPC